MNALDEVKRLAELGKTRRQIADELGVPFHRVRRMRERLLAGGDLVRGKMARVNSTVETEYKPMLCTDKDGRDLYLEALRDVYFWEVAPSRK